MKIELEKLIRPSIQKLRAYQSARSLFKTESGASSTLFLDANEAPDGAFNRYPSPQPRSLLERFASLYGVNSEAILIGRGSDEAIDTLTRAVCEPGRDAIVISPPTYGMYEVAADIQNAEVIKVPALFSDGRWTMNLSALSSTLDRAANRIKIIYVCSPNNPTGGRESLDSIRQLCRLAGPGTLVVVDEAYQEYVADGEPSSTELMPEFSNLVVLRTLSKAWGLAGLRCGVLLGDPALVQVLQKVRAPYPLPQPVIEAALKATDRDGLKQMHDRVNLNREERQRLASALGTLGIVTAVYESEANFLLVRFEDESLVMNACRAGGIILRSRDQEPGLKNCVRITIGSPAENERLLSILNSIGSRAGATA